MIKVLDILLTALLLWGVYSGFKKGLVAELYSIAAFVIASLSSLKLMQFFIEVLGQWNIDCNQPISYMLFIAAFLTIVIIVTLLGKLCRYLINLTALGGLDKVLGATLGATKWGLFILFFFALVRTLKLPFPDSYLGDHYLLPLYQFLEPYCMQWLYNYIFPLKENYNVVSI